MALLLCHIPTHDPRPPPPQQPHAEERALWHALSRFRPRFTRQLQIGPFVADFACRRARLVVEVDGGQHADNAYDAHRTALLESDGWRVVRLWNGDVRENVEGVARMIAEVIASRLPEGEIPEFIGSRAGRPRRIGRREEPPPTPPRSRGGEQE